VAAGSYHTMAVTDAGELFTWGDGRFGKLGHGDDNHKFVPTLVEGLRGQRVVGVAGGLCHTLAW